MKRRKGGLPSHEDFVRVWQACASLQEVVDAFGGGITPAQARNRANYLRRLGVALKRYEPGRPRLDLSHLNDIIKGSIA